MRQVCEVPADRDLREKMAGTDPAALLAAIQEAKQKVSAEAGMQSKLRAEAFLQALNPNV